MSIYDEGFYSRNADASRRSAAAVLRHLTAVHRPASLVDIGGGVGTWASVATEIGIDDILLVDGAHVPRDKLRVPQAQFRAHDLQQPLALGRSFEWALCMEVAEHLPAAQAEDLVDGLCAAAPFVVFSAAIPLQGGDGHVNEMWPEYWAAKFVAQGFLTYDLVRPELWHDRNVGWWYRQNTLVFARAEYMQSHFPDAEPTDSRVLSRIHPECYLSLSRRPTPLRWSYGPKRDVDIYYDPASADFSRSVGYGAEYDSVPHPAALMKLHRNLRGVVVGPGRVGSTHLAALLSQHPEAHCLNESHDLPIICEASLDEKQPAERLIDLLDTVRFHNGRSIVEMNVRRVGLTPENFRQYLQRIVKCFPQLAPATFRRLIDAYFLWATRKRVMIDKTPDYAHHLPLLLGISPDIKILLMVRDAPETVASMLEHEGYRELVRHGSVSWPNHLREVQQSSPGDPDDPVAHLSIWRSRIRAALEVGQTLEPTQFAILRYEALCADPRGEARRLARFFGLDSDPGWLDAVTSSTRQSNRQRESGVALTEDDRDLRAALGYE